MTRSRISPVLLNRALCFRTMLRGCSGSEAAIHLPACERPFQARFGRLSLPCFSVRQLTKTFSAQRKQIRASQASSTSTMAYQKVARKCGAEYYVWILNCDAKANGQPQNFTPDSPLVKELAR
jgi:hypothetical protein